MTPKGRAQWLLIAARKRAGKEKVTISRESIIKAIENGVCQITGLPFDLTTPHGPYSPSLDRTNSDGDYTDENTKVVVLIYNSAKSEWHHNDVVAMARALTMNEINAPVSAGDVVDRLSILTIKMVRMKDPVKLENVKREHNLLRELFDKIYTDLAAHLQMQFAGLSVKLRNVNEKIWDIEDGIRDHERNKDFGPSFVELARGVYHNNDERADLKKEINALVGSNIVEEKSYTDYK